jgi:Domain of unknown function (DUF4333)
MPNAIFDRVPGRRRSTRCRAGARRRRRASTASGASSAFIPLAVTGRTGSTLAAPACIFATKNVNFTITSRHIRLISFLGALVAALSLSGCASSGPTLSTATVERAIAASIRTQHGLRATVSCPHDVPRREGFAFECTASLDAGTYPVLATETNDAGHVSYENRAPLAVLDVAKVERAIDGSIESQRGVEATVSCPPEILQRAGVQFTCTALVGGRTYPFAVTEIDARGHVRYVGR